MKKTIVTTALLLSMASASTFAENAISWNQLSAGYTNQKIDDTGFSFDGVGVRASVELTDNWFAEASYNASEDDLVVDGVDIKVDYTYYQIGVGYAHEVSNLLDVYGAVSYREAEAEVMGFAESVDGYGAEIGLRYVVSRDFELGAFIDYVKPEDDDAESETSFGVDARLKIATQFAIQARASRSSDGRTIYLGGTYYF